MKYLAFFLMVCNRKWHIFLHRSNSKWTNWITCQNLTSEISMQKKMKLLSEYRTVTISQSCCVIWSWDVLLIHIRFYIVLNQSKLSDVFIILCDIHRLSYSSRKYNKSLISQVFSRWNKYLFTTSHRFLEKWKLTSIIFSHQNYLQI